MTASPTTPRTVALDALVKVDDGAFANVLLPTLLRSSGLEPRERAQTTDLVYGTLRRRRALDALLEPLLDRDLDDLDAPVRAALRVGAYQLVDGVAAHAAVSETVDAVAQVAPRAKGYVNAVLRRLAQVGPPWPWPAGDDADRRRDPHVDARLDRGPAVRGPGTGDGAGGAGAGQRAGRAHAAGQPAPHHSG